MRPVPEHRRNSDSTAASPQQPQAYAEQASGVSPRQHVPALFSALTASVLLGLTGGCLPSTSSAELSEPVDEAASPATIAPVPDDTPEAATPSPPPRPAELLTAATTQADQARALADSAQSRDDWTLVISLWEGAIALLDAIPEDAPEHAAAQQNKSAYQESLATAQQAATIPVDTTPRLTTPQPESAESAETAATASDATATTPESTTELADVTAEVALANHLTQSGARMYAAYWCSYCERQQQLFGEAAVQQLEIIECDPRGENPQVDRCRAANISGFPTWEINGQQYPGLQSLDRLANLSGYDGPRDFSN